MSALTRYGQAVRVPHVARLLALGAVARLSPAMELVAMVLFVRDASDSYAMAGAVTATYTIGYAVAAPVQGRMADRYGAARVLWPLAIGHTIALGALVAAGLAGSSGPVLVSLGLVAGLVMPPTGAVVRRAIAQQAARRRDLLPSVFALDALGIEFVFMSGPVLTAVLIAVASPAAALIVACGVAIAAVAGLVVVPAIEVDESVQRTGRLGALRSPGMRTLIGCLAPIGVAYGGFQVGIIAFADDVGASASAPWLLAVLSLGGAIGALVYGSLGHRFASSMALACIAVLLPVCFAPMILATSVLQMALLILLGGAFMTPVIAITNQVVGDVAPPDAVTEAYAWVFMAMLAGMSFGLAVGGRLVEAGNWHHSILLAIGATITVAVVAVSRRRTLPDVGWHHTVPEVT
ncbi:MAG TPA: MFS transporter [Baekduia sp.]|nr:MFS transporter [Baekduia sp.]